MSEQQGKAAPKFDAIIHEPVRLRICGLLAHTSRLQFAVIRDILQINDVTCSKHLKVLAEHGYVKLDKRIGEANRHKVVWAKLTPSGRRAFEGHLAELHRIVTGGCF